MTCMFQSAPLTKARGDHAIISTSVISLTFQSAPLTKARGDQILTMFARWAQCFNPLPSQKQGETDAFPRVPILYIVSIRSPHKSKGRHRVERHAAYTVLFQSAPLTKARGDLVAAASKPTAASFNPLPSQKQGETARWRSNGWMRMCFNPLPSQKQGETHWPP